MYEQAVVLSHYTVKMTANVMHFDNDKIQTAMTDCLLKFPWVASFFKAYWHPRELVHL